MKKQNRRLPAFLLALTMLVSLAACGSPADAPAASEAGETNAQATTVPQTQAPATEAAATESGGLYTPGTYTAAAKGYGGDITVTLTVDSEKITACTAEGPNETQGKGSIAVENLPAAIAEAGNTQVEAISGCTISSKAILQAAQAALSEAAGTAGSPVKMKPGTYTASAYGFIQIAPVEVSVTVDESSILDIQVNGNRDSVAMVRSVNTYMIPRMLKYQSVAVDSISGATATSGAVKAAAAEALSAALSAGGSDPAALAAFQTAEVKDGGEQTLETDVLVVGMGGSGCAAAMSAAEAQADAGREVRVLAIDKAGRFGGTSAFCGEPMAVNAPKYKEEFNNGEDYMDGDALLAAWNEYTEGEAKMEIVEKFLENSGDTIDWLYYDHGFLFNNPLTGFGPEDVYRCKYQYVSAFNIEEGRDYGEEITGGQNTQTDKYFARLLEDYTELGGQYMLETEATELIYDAAGNKVTGVRAVGHDGTVYTIQAKAVILASGGFAGNGAMESEYFAENPYYSDLGGEWNLIGMAQNDGKMIQAAVAIGAGTCNIDMVPMVHFATSGVVIHDYPYHEEAGAALDQWYGWPRGWSLNNVPDAMVLTNMIPWVNTHGERFVKEGAMFSWWLSGPSYWAVWSEDLIDSVAEKGFPAAVFTYASTSQGTTPGETPIPEIREITKKLVDMGVMVKADTLEELAGLMGVPADTFTASMNDYESYCENGADEQYGKDASRLLALGDGPYYAMKGYSSTFSTVGGLDIDENCSVLQKDTGTPIGGLYAVGNESGGVLYTNKKPYVTYGGAALGWAFTSGRLTGITAAGYADSVN
ncbi:MAG: FAD-dependent oxidoreductase [Lachnospiraceae bacterium]|nr:FAD-dependent oxidoreductase [Lachnospiraceae bacterium]